MVGTVFIVDDEMMVTSSLQTMLSLETNHCVHSFNRPADALADALRLRPDVVVSDFSMPDMDGIQFLRRMKELLPESTLILLTGYADKESAIAAINSVGIYRYIEKPWDNEDLKISITNGLERSRLIGDLKQSVSELTAAREALERSNHRLEELIEERTRELRTAWQTLSSIVNNTADGILTLDASLTLTSINPAAERWFRRLEDLREVDLKTLPPERLLRAGPEKSGRPIGLRALFETAGDASPHRLREVFIGDLPLEAGITPLRSPSASNGNGSVSGDAPPEGFVVVLRDITERREIERLRDDFVSTLTHDLRTPLLAAIQTLGFFADGSLGTLPSRQHELITMLIQSHRDMLDLVNVLLEVYKYESGRQRLIRDNLDIRELLGATCRELEALARSREQALTLGPRFPAASETSLKNTGVAAVADLPKCNVYGDKQELKRVFVNLIGNAIHYTPLGGKIRVWLERLPGKAQICVQDNGRGIPARDIPLLFQRFSQGTSRQRSSGSGLGLYLSRQIIEAHQGRIWVESEEDQGSRFYVQLPLADAPSA